MKHFKFLILVSLLANTTLINGQVDSVRPINKQNDEFDWDIRKTKIDSLIKLNYLDREYKFLAKDFSIDIDSAEFVKINYQNRETTQYKDSLGIILNYELQDDQEWNIAFHRILFKWEKVGFYIWEDKDKAEELGKAFGFDHPYRFFKFLNDENARDEIKLELLNDVINRVAKYYGKPFEYNTDTEFLREAFRLNPARITAMQEYMKNYSKHK